MLFLKNNNKNQITDLIITEFAIIVLNVAYKIFDLNYYTLYLQHIQWDFIGFIPVLKTVLDETNNFCSHKMFC